MGSYEEAVRTLEVELRGVEQAFRDLTAEQMPDVLHETFTKTTEGAAGHGT
jgi:hypothetical protein